MFLAGIFCINFIPTCVFVSRNFLLFLFARKIFCHFFILVG